MEELDSLIEAARMEAMTLLNRRRMLEVQVQEANQKYEIMHARLSGLLAAQEIVKAQQEKDARPPVRKRQRRLTDQWRQILSMLAEHTFDYDDLAAVAAMQDHEISRDTLRSQMSGYKSNGIVEAVSEGVFRLTDRGRSAAGLSNEIGDEEEAGDEEEIIG